MNTKKHKGKNRAKVIPTPIPKPCPEANGKSEEVVLEKCSEEALSPRDIMQDQSEVLKTTNEEIIIKSLDLIESIGEIVSTGEMPVKPKRNKGKKKKQTVIEGHQQEKTNDDIEKVEISEETFSLHNVNPVDAPIIEGTTVKPSVRKKKNKDKKHIERSQESLIDVDHVDHSNPEQSETLRNQENDDKDALQVEVKTNKKNKKKKRRHDSEKSDKPDETISCIAAFENLIETKTNDDGIETLTLKNKEDQEIYKEETIDCVVSTEIVLSIENQNEKDLEKTDSNVTKKKKKKEKKLPKLKNDIQKDIDKQNTIQINDVMKRDISNSVVFQTVSEDKSSKNKDGSVENTAPQPDITEEIKPKATIAKPVQKKLVQASDSKSMVETNPAENLNPTMRDSDLSKKDKIEIEDNLSSTGLANDPNIVTPLESNVIGQHDNDKECLKQNTLNSERLCTIVEQPMTEKEFNKKCQKLTIENDKVEIKLETNVDFDIRIQDTNENINQDFINSTENPSISQLNIHKEMSDRPGEVKSSETEDYDTITSDDSCFNAADNIHTPRSISEQMLDDNTNMVLREITSRHEQTKLEIPAVTSNKVQSSGKTTVRTPTITPTNISVTEVDKNKNQEKNDIKSKMLEVNQDLEQIRISLEKSLAELNAMKEKEENEASSYLKTSKINKSKTSKLVKESDVCITSKDTKLASDGLEVQSKAKNVSDSCFENSDSITPPISPPRKDRKGKGKSKKKSRREPEITISQSVSVTTESGNEDTKNEGKAKGKEKGNSSDEKGKQQSSCGNERKKTMSPELQFEPIDNFEDALTSSVDDVEVNKTFEIIANELNDDSQTYQPQKESFITKPEINITPPMDEEEKDGQSKNVNPVSQPKNLLGYPNIPVPSNKTDYKKEKNKTPNEKQAKVKVKDLMDAEPDTESVKKSKESQTDSKIKFVKDRNEIECFSYVTNGKEEYVYKYIFRKVFLASVCHICRKELKQTRIPCKFCNLVFYCNQKHKDEDWPRHQSLCFAVSTVVHLKDQKHIYGDAKNVSGQNYRLIRMQMIQSCEKVLKRKLLPWEQEALLYPRICADVTCREWRQAKLTDCDGCGQVSYCTENPDHLPLNHQRWCKSYALYQKLVLHQQLHGRLEPKLPGKVMVDDYTIPDKINEVLASIYEEKIDMSDIQYAALTQVASAPLTVAFCHQLYRQAVNSANGFSKKSSFTIHAVAAELQFEADTLAKWEVFLLHLKPGVRELRVALIGQELNPANLPLELLGKIRLCESCRENKRRVQFSFQDKKSYHEYWSSDDFTTPDVVCAFNPNIQRSSVYNGVDSWSRTINCIFKQKIPFLITSCTMNELNKDLDTIKKYAEVNYKIVTEAKQNPFASVRPDRNFITDDETPLLFKNYCFSLLCGA